MSSPAQNSSLEKAQVSTVQAPVGIQMKNGETASKGAVGTTDVKAPLNSINRVSAPAMPSNVNNG